MSNKAQSMMMTDRSQVGSPADRIAYPMRGLVLTCLAVLLLIGLTVRGVQASTDVLLYAMTLTTLVITGAGLLIAVRDRRETPEDPIHRLSWRAAWIWLFTFFCVLYGLILSAFAGHDMYVSLSFGMRLIPLALFPAFAFAIRTQRGWFKLLLGLVLIGTVSALIDLAEWSSSDQTGVRLMAADLSSIDYFYGLVTALALMLFVPMKRSLRLLVFAALPILAFRMFLSIIRAWYVIIALVLAYCVLVSWRWLPGTRSRLAMFAIGFVALLLSLVYLGPLDGVYASYLDTYDTRFSVVGSSLRYRWSEISSAFVYSGPLGAGWGAQGDFEEALEFTSSSYYFAVKAYVHNFFAFMFWKLGFLGLIVIGLLIGYVAHHSLNTIRRRDSLGFVIIALWIAWIVHSMVNMNFARPELNVWVAAWLGYFQWRSLWLPEQEDAVDDAPVSLPARDALAPREVSATGAT